MEERMTSIQRIFTITLGVASVLTLLVVMRNSDVNAQGPLCAAAAGCPVIETSHTLQIQFQDFLKSQKLGTIPNATENDIVFLTFTQSDDIARNVSQHDSLSTVLIAGSKSTIGLVHPGRAGEVCKANVDLTTGGVITINGESCPGWGAVVRLTFHAIRLRPRT
jgi:hypothetical protein